MVNFYSLFKTAGNYLTYFNPETDDQDILEKLKSGKSCYVKTEWNKGRGVFVYRLKEIESEKTPTFFQLYKVANLINDKLICKITDDHLPGITKIIETAKAMDSGNTSKSISLYKFFYGKGLQTARKALENKKNAINEEKKKPINTENQHNNNSIQDQNNNSIQDQNNNSIQDQTGEKKLDGDGLEKNQEGSKPQNLLLESVILVAALGVTFFLELVEPSINVEWQGEVAAGLVGGIVNSASKLTNNPATGFTGLGNIIKSAKERAEFAAAVIDYVPGNVIPSGGESAMINPPVISFMGLHNEGGIGSPVDSYPIKNSIKDAVLKVVVAPTLVVTDSILKGVDKANSLADQAEALVKNTVTQVTTVATQSVVSGVPNVVTGGRAGAMSTKKGDASMTAGSLKDAAEVADPAIAQTISKTGYLASALFAALAIIAPY